jgi:ATP-dependent Clp protease ATP-binding subunit ClpX
VICNVHQLRQEDLVAILTEPKNALSKQYRKFFAYDGVDLIFAKDALEAIAEQALKLETGARGLRSIIEAALINVMFELPSRRDVTKCMVTREVIDKRIDPTLVTSTARDELELDQATA